MSQSVPTDEFDTEWTNYGDANPKYHGGRFIQWDVDGEYWELIETYPAIDTVAEWPEDDEESQIAKMYQFYPDDVWVDGEPDKGFTDAMRSILESLGDTNHFEAPGGEPFVSRIGYYVADLPFHMGPANPKRDLWMNMVREEFGEFEEGWRESGYELHVLKNRDYEDLLEFYGIDSWE